jgi:hypothetical protein
MGENTQKPIPERDIKQNSGVSATMALQAAQKAWDYRQAANAAGDPNAREEILAKAINKEIEAESFGKAAKYTQSGTFQGLAAGAGLGVVPGVTLGKVTGAIVGGTVSTVTGLLGAGVGSVYGAMSGPMWNLGEMASHGVRGVVGDFPNWKSTPSQKKTLEKMVMQSKETQAPSEEELKQMKNDMPDEMPQSWSKQAQDMTACLPSMPSMPSMSQAGSAVGLGGLGASLGFGGQEKPKEAAKAGSQPKRPAVSSKQTKPPPSKSQRTAVRQQPDRVSKQESQPKAQSSKPAAKKETASKTAPPKPASKVQAADKPSSSAQSSSVQGNSTTSTGKTAAPSTDKERRKPRKLDSKPDNSKPSSGSTPKRPPKKLEVRKSAAAA